MEELEDAFEFVESNPSRRSFNVAASTGILTPVSHLRQYRGIGQYMWLKKTSSGNALHGTSGRSCRIAHRLSQFEASKTSVCAPKL